jgi:hypothetical protein
MQGVLRPQIVQRKGTVQKFVTYDLSGVLPVPTSNHMRKGQVGQCFLIRSFTFNKMKAIKSDGSILALPGNDPSHPINQTIDMESSGFRSFHELTRLKYLTAGLGFSLVLYGIGPHN